MRFQKNCDPIVGHSPAAARPDMIVGKKTKSFYCFFPHVNSDWIAKESGTAAAWLCGVGGGAAGTLRPRRGISHGLSQPPHIAPQPAATPRYVT